MKKILGFAAAATALLTLAVSCEQKEKGPKTVPVEITLSADGSVLEVEGVVVTVEASGVTYSAVTSAEGIAEFKLLAGPYTASASFRLPKDGTVYNYNGSSTVNVEGSAKMTVSIPVTASKSSQIIIKELYSTGCPKNETGNYIDDAYVILYNNSAEEADATDIVFSLIQPTNAHGSNKYYTEGKLLYEDEDWILGYSALWWFTSEVKIPAYSQIVIALFGAIDHTATVTASVDLSDPSYYWMSNTEISSVFKHAKYVVSESIPQSHYLTGYPVSIGTAWVISSVSPGFYIGRMPSAQADALCKDTENYEKTSMTNVKFPVANVVDVVEAYSAANLEKSQARFPAKLNTGYVAITNNLGHTIYRNVDKEATEALAENEGKLVYDYSGGTYNAENGSGSTDPSGIDAEASIKNGAHIIYMDTNDSGKDFHERAVSSIKK